SSQSGPRKDRCVCLRGSQGGSLRQRTYPGDASGKPENPQPREGDSLIHTQAVIVGAVHGEPLATLIRVPCPRNQKEKSEPRWTRTIDPILKRDMLYQLS